MKVITDNSCPKCGSKSIIDTGDNTERIRDFNPSKLIQLSVVIPIFKCKNCEESFKVK